MNFTICLSVSADEPTGIFGSDCSESVDSLGKCQRLNNIAFLHLCESPSVYSFLSFFQSFQLSECFCYCDVRASNEQFVKSRNLLFAVAEAVSLRSKHR